MNAFSRSKVTVDPGGILARAERLEGDDGEGVLDARNELHLLVHEVADVGVVVDIELDQEVVMPCGGIDLRGDLGFRKRVGDGVGLAKLALDLDEEGNHRGRLRASIDPNRPDLPAKASSKASHETSRETSRLAGDGGLR